MIYIHIPFCHRKCAYCAFYSVANGDRDAYVDALVDRNFRDLIERTLIRYDRLPVGVVGGFGNACRAELERLGAEYGLTFSRFIPSPMEGLIDYHGL